MAGESLLVSGSAYNVAQWPETPIARSILWEQDAAGYWNGSDRGAAQDVYQAECVFVDKESTINALETTLDAAREGITLSGFTAPVFAPNVDHTGSISATVVKTKRKHLKFGVPAANSQMYALEVAFRAISPTILSTTPSLSTLKLQESFDADQTYESLKAFSYNQTAFYADHRSDVGVFRGRFRQKLAQIQAILGYALVTARGGSFAFPNIGVTYPFGISRGAYGTKNCKIKSLSISRRNFVFWDLTLELVEAP